MVMFLAGLFVGVALTALGSMVLARLLLSGEPPPPCGRLGCGFTK